MDGIGSRTKDRNIYVVVSEAAGPGHTPIVYSGAGLDPTQAKILLAKSIVDFREGFKPVGKQFIMGEAPGAAPSDLSSLELRTIDFTHKYLWAEKTAYLVMAITSVIVAVLVVPFIQDFGPTSVDDPAMILLVLSLIMAMSAFIIYMRFVKREFFYRRVLQTPRGISLESLPSKSTQLN